MNEPRGAPLGMTEEQFQSFRRYRAGGAEVEEYEIRSADPSGAATLTAQEEAVLNYLAASATAFFALDPTHPADKPEFVAAIHACQRIVANRAARRANPVALPEVRE